MSALALFPGHSEPDHDTRIDPDGDHVTDLVAGLAAEHLVCADLLLAGYRAFRADQHCPYDVVLERPGRLIRIQVKATKRDRRISMRMSHSPAYMFSIKRSGTNGRRPYRLGDFDAWALVGLDRRLIAYVPYDNQVSLMHLRVPGVTYQKSRLNQNHRFDDYTLDRCLAALAAS